MYTYDISVTLESDYWGNLLIDMPYKSGYPATLYGGPDNWDPGDPGCYDLNKAKVTFLDVNIAKSYPIKELSPRVFKYVDEWLFNYPERWQSQID